MRPAGRKEASRTRLSSVRRDEVVDVVLLFKALELGRSESRVVDPKDLFEE